jgi:hypothetical protein
LNVIESFKRTGQGLQSLEQGPSGYQCSEGDTIVFQARAHGIPKLLLRGEAITPTLLSQDGDIFIAEFERLIDVWAGRTEFLLQDGSTRHSLTLDIGPKKLGLGPSAWDDLIEELSSISTSLPWGMSPGQAAGRMTQDALAAVHPAIIEQQLPVFLQLLRQILSDPPSLMLRVRTVRPLSMSRGADRQTIRWLSRHPLELAGLRGAAPADWPPNPRALADQPKLIRSFDHPMTRYIAFLLKRVHARLDATATSLRSAPQHGVPDPSVSMYAQQLALNVDRGKMAIDAVLKSNLFRTVKSEPATDTVLQSLPDNPLYSAIHRVGRRLANPGLAYAPGQDIYSALKNSYDLFEIMVLYRLVTLLGFALPPQWHATSEAHIRRLPLEDRPPDGAIWAWEGPDDHLLELVYQPRFPPARPPPDKRLYSSLTAQGVPDYVLALWKGNEIISWVILDAKYRSGRRSVHEGLSDIHRYRDSLRICSAQAAAAYIVVPHLQSDAALYGDPDYVDAHHFGAMVIYETGWANPILSWLNGIICGHVTAASAPETSHLAPA